MQKKIKIQKFQKSMKKKAFAHRGLFDNEEIPENSITAFKRAVEYGFGIELDVQYTKDKVPVVFHDYDLKRMCGISKKVRDCTWRELKKYHLGSSKETIPSFEEVLGCIKGTVPLLIEYKIPRMDVRICAAGERLLKDYSGYYCIESFHPLALLWYQKNRPDILRGQLISNFIKDKEKGSRLLFILLHKGVFCKITKPDFIAYNYKYRKEKSFQRLVKKCQALSFAWTIRSAKEQKIAQKNFQIIIFEGFFPK